MNRTTETDVRRALHGAVDTASDQRPETAEDLTAWLAERAAQESLLDVAYGAVDTPFGQATVAATEHGLVRVILPNEDRDGGLERIARDVSPRIIEAPARVDRARREIDEYLAGRRRAFDLDVDMTLARGDFYRRVLEQLRAIEFGHTLTYGEVAKRAGNARAHRAAGTACGSNPLPIVVPCHRVIRSGGDIGNYGGGPEMKRFLLELEGAL
jgi:methylated-DNA-[protein]-cysteine S-methyltransferase